MEAVSGIRVSPLLVVLTAGLAWPQGRVPELGFPTADETQSTRVSSIRGIVVDENGALIPKAEIILRRVKGGHIIEMAHIETDPEGRFQLSASEGRYEIDVRRLGFKEQRIPIQVSRKGVPGFRVQMRVQTVVLVN